MAARIKVFLDEECTKELYREPDGTIFYRLYKDNEDGTHTTYIDGITGGSLSFDLYFKNVGTRAALGLQVTAEPFVGRKIINTSLFNVGDIAVDEVKSITVPITVSPWSAAQINQTTLTLDYYSLPDITPEHTPYMLGQEYVPDTDSTYKVSDITDKENN